MFDPIAILTAAGAFLFILWLSLLIARFLMWAILESMRHGAHRRPEAALVPTPTKQHVRTKLSIGEPLEDSHRR